MILTAIWVIICYFCMAGCSDSTPIAKQTKGPVEAEIGKSGNLDPSVVLPSSVALPRQEEQTFAAIKAEYEAADKQYRKEMNDKALALQREAVAAQKADEAHRQLELTTNNQPSESQPSQPVKATMRSLPMMPMIGPGDGPGATFAPRFLAFAETNPQDDAAFDSLSLALRTSGGPASKNGIWSKVVQMLRTNHVSAPEIKRLFAELTAPYEDAANQLIRDVAANHPDRRVQARACKALARGLSSASQRALTLTENAALREIIEGQRGKEYVESLIANAERNRKEAEHLDRLVLETYNDVLPDVSIGQKAPEVLNMNVDGTPAKLSALRGKVVVLDIWATWCGPCVAMIPHEREMVDRLKDKPFELVSISVDEEKDTLTKFLSKNPMPWTNWWNGHESGILVDWDVTYFPTIYVLDAQGVIRFKDLRGEKLEEAVNELLHELESAN